MQRPLFLFKFFSRVNNQGIEAGKKLSGERGQGQLVYVIGTPCGIPNRCLLPSAYYPPGCGSGRNFAQNTAQPVKTAEAR